MPKISRAKLLAAATTVLVLLLACNLELLPLALLVDAIGLDALALLLGAQMLAVLPWLRAHSRRPLRMTWRSAVALFAGCIGGYLRQLVLGAWLTRSAFRHRTRSARPAARG